MAKNIQICVRIRPENAREHSPNLRQIVQALGDKTVVFDPPETDAFGNSRKAVFSSQNNKDLKFAFDHVFGPESSQFDVYKNTTAEILDSVMSGFNCCVFAYGATGAGKTYTMLGAKEEPGVIFRTVMELYNKIEQCAEYSYNINVSYLEIYNEILKDLLQPGGKISLREGSDGIVTVTGVSIHNPKKANDLMEMLHRGNAERTQQKTLANSESSRSHAIFQIYLKARPKGGGTVTTWKYSKFSLIDLAGSERGTVQCGAKQQREGSNINRSLLALGNVINALAEKNKNPKVFVPYRDSKLTRPLSTRHSLHSKDKKPEVFVPYRDSKLTRLLKDSLGGSCQTIMIANLSPSSMSYEDSYNTLKYANRAKNIKVVAVENVMEVKSHVKEYAEIIEKLKKENQELRKELAESNKTADKMTLKKDFEKAYNDFDGECRAVFRARAGLKKEVTSLEAEEQTNAIKLQQKRWCLTMIENMGWEKAMRDQLSAEISELETEAEKLSLKLTRKKKEIDDSVDNAEILQNKIYNYIEENRNKMDSTGPALLTQLWEYHLVKVQSYYAEHSVLALRAYAATCQRHLQRSNNIGYTVVENQCQLVTGDENIPTNTREHIQSTLSSVCQTMVEPKKKGIKWSDTPFNLPSSSLFPSPKLVQPHSPQLSFTPGKLQVGSTPQLNKLQRATFQDGRFVTPGPDKPISRAISRLADKPEEIPKCLSPSPEVSSPSVEPTPPTVEPTPPSTRFNLLERFNNIKRKTSSDTELPLETPKQVDDSPVVSLSLDDPVSVPLDHHVAKSPSPPPSCKSSEEKLQELYKNTHKPRSRPTERSLRPLTTNTALPKRKPRLSKIPNRSSVSTNIQSGIGLKSARTNLVSPFPKTSKEIKPTKRLTSSSENEPKPEHKSEPKPRTLPRRTPTKSPLRSTIKNNSSIKKSALKTPTRVRSKSPLREKPLEGQRSKSK